MRRKRIDQPGKEGGGRATVSHRAAYCRPERLRISRLPGALRTALPYLELRELSFPEIGPCTFMKPVTNQGPNGNQLCTVACTPCGLRTIFRSLHAMRSLFLTLLFSLAVSSSAFALSIAGPPPEHDWTVTIAHRHYGIGGDSRGSYISYGRDFVWGVCRSGSWSLSRRCLRSPSAREVGLLLVVMPTRPPTLPKTKTGAECARCKKF